MAIPTTTATEVYVINMDTDAEYYSLSATTVGYKASTLKLLTLYTMMASASGYSTKSTMQAATEVVISADIVGGTGVALVAGHTWDMWSLALNMMFASSNDACQVIARHVGTRIYVDAGSTGTTGVARFVEAMVSYASTIGMTDTTITRPDGLGGSGQETTVKDLGKLCAYVNETVFDYAEFIPVFKQFSTTIDYDDGAPQTRIVEKEGIYGAVPGYKMSKAGTTGHYWLVAELPNGQHVSICTSGSSQAAAVADHLALYRQLLIDYPTTLAVPGSPATLAWMASESGGNLVAWSDDSLMYQDDGTSTPCDDNGEFARRWYPDTEIGVSGNYFRADSDALRPERDTSVSGRLFDLSGGSYMMHLGAKGIGAATHFATSGQSWMTMARTFGSATSGTVFSRRGASSTMQFFYNSASSRTGNIRNSNSAGSYGPTGNLSGQESVHGTVFDGTYHQWVAGTVGGDPFVPVGTQADGTDNFSIFERYTGSYPWEGGWGRTIMCDAYHVTVREKMRDWCFGVVTNQFRDAAGTAPGGGSIVALMMQLHS